MLLNKSNDVYYKTNNIYSLYLAKDYLLKDDTLLLESDLIFDEGLVRDMVSYPYATAAAVAKWEAWMDGTVVELSGDNEIGAFIPKKAFLYDLTGKKGIPSGSFVRLAVRDRNDNDAFVACLARYMRDTPPPNITVR